MTYKSTCRGYMSFMLRHACRQVPFEAVDIVKICT
jgi:hypothetical protein